MNVRFYVDVPLTGQSTDRLEELQKILAVRPQVQVIVISPTPTAGPVHWFGSLTGATEIHGG